MKEITGSNAGLVQPASEPEAGERLGILWWLVPLAAVVARVWVMQLRSSLWLDETATFWEVKEGLAQVAARSAMWREWPVYPFLAGLGHTLGSSEAFLRLPSLLAMGVATFLLYRLGRRAVGREAALAAVVVFACHPQVAFSAADARAYAVALALAMGAMIALVRWMDTGRLAHAVAYVALAALTEYTHNLFATMFAVHLIYALIRLRTGARVGWRALVAAAGAIGVLLAPLAWQFLSIYKGREEFAGSKIPPPREFFELFVPLEIAAALLCAFLLIRLFFSRTTIRTRAIPQPTFLWLFCWWVIPFGIMYMGAVLTPLGTFISRYLIVSAPAMALLAGWLLSAIRESRARWAATMTFALVAIVCQSSVRHLWLSHGYEDWRGAVSRANALAGPDTPVFLRGAFGNAIGRKWLSGARPEDRMSSPYSAYPIRGRVIPVPFRLDKDAAEYLERVKLDGTSRVLFIGRPGGAEPFKNWLAVRLGCKGYTAREVPGLEGVSVVVFDRQGG
jgi:4-amino-4-deoxy-L-arabinose transferase-like glycosyltransferase